MNESYREHPIKILFYTAKNLWLLLFPLLRSLRYLTPLTLQSLVEWGRGVWIDLIVVIAIIGIGVLRWYQCSYNFQRKKIVAKSGLIFRVETKIPFDNITSTTLEHPLYLRPFRAARLQISTAAGNDAESNLKLYLSVRRFHALRLQIPWLHSDGRDSTPHHVSVWYVLLFSALFSSSFSGAFYLAILISQSGRIISDIWEEVGGDRLIEDAADRASRIFSGIPRIGLVIGIIILACWLISFGHNLLRYSRFRVKLSGEFLSIHMGVINRRHIYLRDNDIIFSDLRQNLFMKIFGAVSLHIRCPGYGGRYDTLPVLIPLARQKQSWELLSNLHARGSLSAPMYSARPRAIRLWSFIWKPFMGLAIVGFLLWGGLMLFEQFRGIIIFFAVLMILPLAWFLVIKIVSCFTQVLSMNATYVSMRFSHGFMFHTITVRRARIVRVDIIQTPIQKAFGCCHLYLIMQGTRRCRYKLTAMPEEAARLFVKQIQGD